MMPTCTTIRPRRARAESGVKNLMRGAALRGLVAVGALVATAGSTVAQANNIRPPAPSGEPSGAGFASAVVGLALIALVVFAAAFPSRRGHQD